MSHASILDELFSLKGQVALVTGASSGIGAQFARDLARAGADVILAARRLDRIEALAQELSEQTGRKAIAVKMDVTEKSSVEAGFDAAIKSAGVPTIICNNAGMAWPKWAIDSDDADWDATMETNLKGMWRVATIAAKHMRDAGLKGSIINTASILGFGVGPKYMTYSTSKAAVIQMTKSMAVEFQH